MRTVIAFCGAAGSGKDEAARVLINKLGFSKRSFAEPLRAEVHRAMVDPEYCDIVWHEMPRVCRDALLDCMAMGDHNPWRKPTSADMRRLLQVWGTEFRRGRDPDYWTKAEAAMLANRGQFIYTDVRFPNEYEMVRSLGGLVFCIKRDDVVGNGHVSESHWPHFAYDRVIENNGTIADLRSAVLNTITDALCIDLHEETLP